MLIFGHFKEGLGQRAEFFLIRHSQFPLEFGQSETKEQICAKRNGGTIYGQWAEVPTLHCSHARNKEFVRAIACHDFDDMTVGIDGCPKGICRSRGRSTAFNLWIRRLRHKPSCVLIR
jgi:hypothetical protein